MALNVGVTNPNQLTQAQLDANKARLAAESKNRTGSDIGNFIDTLGSALRLPEIGLSEALSGGNKTINTARPVGVDITGGVYNVEPTKVSINPNTRYTNSTSTPELESPVDIYGNKTGTGTASAIDEANYYQDQINRLNDLLGFSEKQKESGLANLESSYKSALDIANRDYAEQALKNEQAKQKGIEEVGTFASDSYNNLRRLLLGSNAGASSVMRDLVPYLVAKSAGTRRQEVFNTAGENAQNITKAKSKYEQDLLNQRNTSTQDFLSNLLQKQNDIEQEKATAIYNKSQATGAGYGASKAAAQGTTGSIQNRMAELSSLFDKYKPSYTTATTPELGTYTLDKASISAGNTPAETTYYSPQLKKLKELLG